MGCALIIQRIACEWHNIFPCNPANQNDEAERLEGIHLWNDIEPPARPDFPGDLRDWEKRSYGKAYLNPLGRKLLGLEFWLKMRGWQTLAVKFEICEKHKQ